MMRVGPESEVLRCSRSNPPGSRSHHRPMCWVASDELLGHSFVMMFHLWCRMRSRVFLLGGWLVFGIGIGMAKGSAHL
jgi:hypothetical protein